MIARHLAKIPGRKNLIWLTASFPVTWPARPQVPLVDFTSDLMKVARSLNNANISLYAVDAHGQRGALSGDTPLGNAETTSDPSKAGGNKYGWYAPFRMPDGVDTMELLASRTGGAVYLNTNGLEESMRAAVEDADLTYVIGFYAVTDSTSQTSRDLIIHSLKVRVARPGVSVRYREDYSASGVAVPVDRPTSEQLLADPLDATQIGLSANVNLDRANPGSYQMHLRADLRDMKLEHQADSWVGELTVSLGMDGSKSFRVITYKVQIPDNQLAANLQKGDIIDASVKAQPGILRIAVQDQITGAAGSLRVPLPAN